MEDFLMLVLRELLDPTKKSDNKFQRNKKRAEIMKHGVPPEKTPLGQGTNAPKGTETHEGNQVPRTTPAPSTQNAQEHPRQPLTQPTRPALDDDTRAVLRAADLMNHGCTRRACRALESTQKLAPRNMETATKLEHLHPKESTPMPQPPATSTGVILTTKIVDKGIKTLKKCVTPGIDGWTKELLWPILKDPAALKGLTALLQDVVNGNVSQWTRDLLCAAELTPFEKPNGGIRPIAPESAILKLAIIAAMLTMEEGAIGRVLAPCQFGVGRPGGPETAAHRYRGAFKRTRFGIAIDVINAYNTMYRRYALEAMYSKKELKNLWKITAMIYGSASRLVFYDDSGTLLATLQSTRGVRQGCVLGPLLFALGIDAILRDIEALLPPGDITAYLDDITICPGPNAQAMMKRLVLSLAERGMTINLSKTTVYSTDPKTPPIDWGALDTEWKGITKPTVTSLVALGTAVGISDGDEMVGGTIVGPDNTKEEMKKHAMSIVMSHQRFFRLLEHPQMPAKAAFHLLRASALPRLNYLMRTTPPDIIRDAVVVFDGMILKALRHVLGTDDKDLTTARLSLLQLPARVGGLGIRLPSSVLEYAYECSLRKAENTGVDVPSQNDITRQVEDDAWIDLRPTLPPPIRAAALSASGPRAAACFSNGCEGGLNEMTDDAFRAMLRFRLDLDPLEGLEGSKRCACTTSSAARHHALCCVFAKGDRKRMRHDAIKKAIAEALVEIGIQTFIEPTQYAIGSSKRPDIVVRIKGQVYAIEVSVAHPQQVANRQHAAETQGTAAALRVAQKHAKYDDICNRLHHNLIVCAVETYGSQAG